MTIKVDNIEFDFSSAISSRRFDISDHGLSHCMTAVDIIVELKDKIFFIEVKNPQRAPQSERQKYLDELKRGKENWRLIKKARDSFLYEWCMQRISKPVYYYVLIVLEGFDKVMMSTLRRELMHNLPVVGPAKNPWKRKFVEDCLVFSYSSWNQNLKQFPIKKV